MIIHYIKTAFRNLLKYKLQSIVSIIGVSIGLVSFIFGYQWFEYETTYDNFYPRSQDMYMVANTELQTGNISDNSPLVLTESLKKDFPEVEEVIIIYGRYGSTILDGERMLSSAIEEFIDESFLKFFPSPIICGSVTGVGLSKDDLILTRSYAIKNFGSPEDAINKKLVDAYGQELEVKAIIENYPENSIFSHIDVLRTDIFTRMHANDIPDDLKWQQHQVKVFVCLSPKADSKEFEEKLNKYLTDNKYNTDIILDLIPLSSIRHTFSSDQSFSINYIRIFAVTTFILLVCVLINFINLWVNNIRNRIREMRLRHSLGAGKTSLVIQLLTEIVLQFVFILFLSCCMIELLLPLFTRIFDIKVDVNELWINFLIVYFIGLVVIVLISLPSIFYFIRQSALQVSGGVKAHRVGLIRNAGMVFQVGVCIAFVFCTICISHQVYFMMNKDLGFKKEGLINFLITNDDREATTREIESIPLIRNFTAAGIFTYSHDPILSNHVNWEGKPDNFKPNFQLIDADNEFIITLGLKIIEGDATGFQDSTVDANRVLINREAARLIGRDNPVGTIIQRWNYGILNGVYMMDDQIIIGVVENFQSASLRNPILPQIISLNGDRYGGYSYYARVDAGKEDEGIKQIREAFIKHALDIDPEPEIYAMSEVLQKLHKSEEGSLRLFIMLASLSVLISLFGIYSISYSNMQRRRKEVAVRKVMGGSVKNIIRMFIFEYLRIVVIANLLFIPFAWYFVHKWVQQFTYQAPAGWSELIIVVILSALLVLVTVLGHILKVSSENPADVVKSE